MDPLTDALLTLDWYADRLAELTPGTTEHADAQARYDHWYARASALQTRRDEQDHADTWLEFANP